MELILFLLIFFLFSSAALASTYYGSPTGSDSNSGTVSAPFKTIQKAANIVNPGDTVIVKDGVYIDTNGDNAIVNLSRPGTSSGWITFRAENRWGAVLDGQNYATNYCWLNSLNANYIKIEDFEMRNCIKAMHNSDNDHDIHISRNYIHHIGHVATNSINGKAAVFAARGTYNLTFDSNIFHTIGRLNPWASIASLHQCSQGRTAAHPRNAGWPAGCATNLHGTEARQR